MPTAAPEVPRGVTRAELAEAHQLTRQVLLHQLEENRELRAENAALRAQLERRRP